MPGTQKRWKTKIVLDYPSNIHASKRITTYLYGETIEHLKLEVRAYLRKQNPPSFNNGGDHITGKLIYFYQDERSPSANLDRKSTRLNSSHRL